MNFSKPNIGGIVLCGGKSSRMGRPKHLLPFGDELLLQRIVRIVSKEVGQVVVVAAADQELPELPVDVNIVRDKTPHLGPLAGLLQGLRALRSEVTAAYLTGCDVPLLKPDFVRGMISLLGPHDAVVPLEEQFLHPLAAVYRTSLIDAATALVESGNLRPRALIERCHARLIPVAELTEFDPRLDSLSNMNRLEEYESLLQRFQELSNEADQG